MSYPAKIASYHGLPRVTSEIKKSLIFKSILFCLAGNSWELMVTRGNSR